MRFTPKGKRVLGLPFTALLSPLSVYSQTVTGRILGTVIDQTRAAIRGATVSITDAQRGTTRTMTTDETGAYVAPHLVPGVYTVRAEAKGFKTMERVNVQVEVARDVVIDLTLPTGNTSE